MDKTARLNWLIASYLGALVLTLVGLNAWIDVGLVWSILVIIYAPQAWRFAAVVALGVFVDLVQGQLLGTHSLSYLLVGFCFFRLRPLFLYYPVWQQTMLFGLMMLFGAQIIFWLQVSLLGLHPLDWGHWGQVLLGALVWPTLHVMVTNLSKHALK